MKNYFDKNKYSQNIKLSIEYYNLVFHWFTALSFQICIGKTVFLQKVSFHAFSCNINISCERVVSFFSEKMPRNYIPVNNKKRTYKACCTADLKSVAEAVKEGMSYRKAWKNFDMKKSTLHDFIRKGGVKSAGRPTLLSAEDEKAIAELADTVAEWGFPLGPMEIKLITKDLLDSKGEVSRCQDNMPGDDWFAGFMKRNKMSARFASNIKRSRSKVDAEDITSFFNELEKTLQEAGIEELIPDNIYNYDEMNFTNNPGNSQKRHQ